MMEGLRQLGVDICCDRKKNEIVVHGIAGKPLKQRASLYVGNAGTAARFLSAFVCIQKGGEYEFTCSPAMEKRPMNSLLACIEQMGAAEVIYHKKSGHVPFILKTKGIKEVSTTIDASESSQFLSALMMIAPFGIPEIVVKGEKISAPFIDMTMSMMESFGYSLIKEKDTYRIKQECKATSSQRIYNIEPDYSAASYFLSLAYIHKTPVCLSEYMPYESVQGDAVFLDILKSLTDVDCFDFRDISDTFITLAAIAPLLKKGITIHGIEHTRKQETDRVHAVATELIKLGQEVEEGRDFLKINPKPLVPCTIETYGDHRIAMAFGILGSFDVFKNGKPWLNINNPGCCEKTYPNFFSTLESLHYAT